MTITIEPSSRPVLARHMRMKWDPARERYVLLGPESVTVLNGTGAAILDLCDGHRTVTEIVDALRGSYRDVSGGEVADYLARLATSRCVELPHE
jgi:pyrroloquinoline quinone biosynthesis protein D